MAISRVASQATGKHFASSSVGTTTIAFPGNVSNGNTVIVGVIVFDDAADPGNPTISQSAGSGTIGVVVADKQVVSNFDVKMRLGIYHVPVIGSGSMTLQVAATRTGNFFMIIGIQEWAGSGIVVDGIPVSNTGTVTPESTGNITNQNGGAIFALSAEQSTADFTYSALTGTEVFKISTGTSTMTGCTQDYLSAGTTLPINVTISTNYSWHAIGVAYKEGGGGGGGGGGTGPVYSTLFPLTENPISEGSAWINGGTTGLDWHNMRTTPALAFGTQDGSTQYTDSLACLTGQWGNDQIAIATVHTVSQTNTVFEEVELLLRFSIAAHRATGYEFTFRCLPSSDGARYVQINRWNGNLGSFTQLKSVTGPGLNDGDVIKATAIAGVLSLYVNNTLYISYNTATGNDGGVAGSPDSIIYGTGAPGIGHYNENGAVGVDSNYGLSDFSVSTSALPPVATNTSAPNINWRVHRQRIWEDK